MTDGGFASHLCRLLSIVPKTFGETRLFSSWDSDSSSFIQRWTGQKKDQFYLPQLLVSFLTPSFIYSSNDKKQLFWMKLWMTFLACISCLKPFKGCWLLKTKLTLANNSRFTWPWAVTNLLNKWFKLFWSFIYCLLLPTSPKSYGIS